jgi:N-acetylglucosamine kinase-like BadF-type ATPase
VTRCFLGADVGGTKTHVLLTDETGRAVGFGESGPGNPEGVGFAGLSNVIYAAAQQALRRAGLRIDQIAGAGFGIAGYDWPSQRAATLAALEPLGLACPHEIVNDAIIGLLAGASEGWGVAVVAGTGCNCRGWDRQRREGRVVGMGSWPGESGGASELVERALRSIAYEWVRRGPPTALSPALMALVKARGLEDFVEGLTTGRYHIGAEAAPVVFRVAAEGDPVALDVIRWAGGELGELANAVIRQLNFEMLDFEVVLVGSTYNGSPLLIDSMRETVHALAPGARLVRLTAPPVVGGVLLGMEQVGVNGWLVRQALVETTNDMRRRIATDTPIQAATDSASSTDTSGHTDKWM